MENKRWQKIQAEFCINFSSIKEEERTQKTNAQYWDAIREFCESSKITQIEDSPFTKEMLKEKGCNLFPH